MADLAPIPIDAIRSRHDDITGRLTAGALEGKERQQLQRELSHLTAIIDTASELEQTRQELAETKKMSAENRDEQLAALYEEEVVTLEQRIGALTRNLDQRMAPESEHDERSVYVEVRAGAGGQEAALFAGDLLKMYTNYALKQGWQAAIASESPTDLGGYREVVLHVQGKGVYGQLKRESGVHRVQRVPETEASGRIHTSTATVAVLPEAKEVDVSINPADLRIDVFRASGAGGQHVNTTDSAVRITHMPTGVVVSCQDERSQHKNKNKAMKMLQSKLLAAQMEAHAAKVSKQRKEQVGTGMRAEKVRTYNFPQNRITDHQANLTLKKLDMVMLGNLDEIVDALRMQERETARAQFLSTFS